MKNRCGVCALFLAVFALGFVGPARAERPATTRLLPDGTLVYVSIPSVRELVDGFNSAAMGRMLQDEKLKPLVRQLYGSAAEAFGQFQERVGLSLDELMTVPQGEICIAIVPVERSMPSLFFLLDVGDQLQNAQKLLDRLDEELQRNGAAKESQTAGGTRLNIYAIPQGGINTLVQFEKDGAIVMCTNLECAKQILARWHGEGESGLADNQRFTAVYNRCKGTRDESPQVIWYVNPIELAKAALGGSVSGRLGLAVLPALGLDGLHAFGGSVIFNSEEFDTITHMHLLLETPRAGVIKALALGAGETTPEAWVPSDVVSYMTLHLDFETAYSEAGKLYNSFRGENALKNELQNRIGDRLGVDVEMELLSALDGRITYITWMEPPVRINSQCNLMGIKLKDAAAARETVGKILARYSDAYTKQSFGGVTYYEFPIRGTQQADGQPAMNLRQPEPCLAIVGDYLLVSDSVQCLQQAIITKSDPAKSLANDLEYKLVASKIQRHSGGTKPGMISFARPEASFRALYDLANADDTRRNLANRAEENRFFKSINDALKDNPLPPFAVIAQYLAPTGGMLLNDETGFHYMTFGLRRKMP